MPTGGGAEDGTFATLTWHDERMSVQASPLSPDMLALDWPKLAQIVAEAPDGTAQPPVVYVAEEALLKVWLRDDRVLPVLAELRGVSATVSSAEAPMNVLESFVLTGRYGDGEDEPSGRWEYEATNLQGEAFLPLDGAAIKAIEHASGVIDVYGPLPDTSSNAAMAQWRDAGGRIELGESELTAPALKLAWQGHLTLDPEMRPVMALDTTVQGLAELLGSGDDGGADEGKAIESLTVLLFGLLSGQSDPGGPMHFNFETKDGRVFVGSLIGAIRIGSVGPIDFEASDGPLIPFTFRFKD